MAKPIQIKVSYEESRSAEYQSARVGAEITLELAEGENAGQVFLEYQKALQARVGNQAAERVEALVAEKKERGWR